jgi:hypothetical protein
VCLFVHACGVLPDFTSGDMEDEECDHGWL